MGKVLVASDVGGHKELIHDEETGVLFKAGNEDALTESLEKLLKSDTLRNELQQRGMEWVGQHHTWEQTTAVYQDIYAGLTEDPAVTRSHEVRG